MYLSSSGRVDCIIIRLAPAGCKNASINLVDLLVPILPFPFQPPSSKFLFFFFFFPRFHFWEYDLTRIFFKLEERFLSLIEILETLEFRKCRPQPAPRLSRRQFSIGFRRKWVTDLSAPTLPPPNPPPLLPPLTRSARFAVVI